MFKLSLGRYCIVWFRSVDDLFFVVPNNSWKKRIFRKLVYSFPRVCEFFLYDDSDDIPKLLAQLSISEKDVDAVYSNLSRTPSRIYVWFREAGERRFAKIFAKGELPKFDLETEKINQVRSLPFNIEALGLISSGVLRAGLCYGIYESLSRIDMRIKRPLTEDEFEYIFNCVGDFHPNLIPENVFKIRNRTVLVDFEELV